MKDLWQEFKGDFNSMTDEEIEEQVREATDKLSEAEAWLEAVQSWKEAGKPRSSKTQRQIDEIYEMVGDHFIEQGSGRICTIQGPVLLGSSWRVGIIYLYNSDRTALVMEYPQFLEAFQKVKP